MLIRRTAFLATLLVAWPLRAQESTALFVPVVLSSTGRNDSYFTSEMVETNKGSRDAAVSYAYADATGAGANGTVSNPQPLAAGRQRVIPDVIAYLRGLGVPIPSSGNAVGTLRVTFANLRAASDAAITVRTTTPVPAAAPTGRAGLAYAGVPPMGLLSSSTTALLCGLKQNAFDRTNVAFQNGGAAGDGDVTLRISIIPNFGFPTPDQFVTLSPGGFKQYALSDLSATAAEAFVRVTVTSGTAPWYAYAVVNDQANSDGSFIAPVKGGTGAGSPSLVLPTVVETPVYATEVVLTNLGGDGLSGVFTFTSTSISTPDHTVNVPVALSGYEQRTYANIVQTLRAIAPAGVPAAGGTIVGTLAFRPDTGDASGAFLGGRTLSAGGGGRYGVFTSALPEAGGADRQGTWVYGLRQDAQNRTNLALVNLGNANTGPIGLHLDLYDGATGLVAGSTDQIVPALGFLQLNTILSQFAPAASQGYARITRTSGASGFLAYAVVNDGAAPGQRSGDGAVVAMDPFDVSRYAGTWHNVTFNTTGSARASLALERASQLVAITLDLGGNVFGEGTPGTQLIRGKTNATGTTFTDTTPLFGPISATVTPAGVVSGSAPTVPGNSVSALTFDGSFLPGVSLGLDYTATLLPSGVAYGSVTMTPAP